MEKFNLFIGFLGELKDGYVKRSELSDSFITDPRDHFFVGMSVRAYVLDIQADKFFLSLKHSLCHSVDISYLKDYFLEEDTLAQQNTHKKNIINWSHFIIGTCIEVTVHLIKEFGVIFHTENKKVTGFAINHQIKGIKCIVGMKMKARILDIDKDKNILDLSLRPELIYTPENISKQLEILKPNTLVEGTIELIKENYLVILLPIQNLIAFSPTKDYNQILDPFSTYKVGQKCKFHITEIPDNNMNRILLLPYLSNISENKENIKFIGIDSADNIQPGMLLKCKILMKSSKQMIAALGKYVKARIFITEVDDLDNQNDLKNHPFDKFKIGDVVDCKILSISNSFEEKFLPITHSENIPTYQRIELTLRPSILALPSLEIGPPRPTWETLKKGDIVHGYIHQVTLDALWVHIGPSIRGRVFVLDASDDIDELTFFQEKFRPGQLVKCRIMAIDSKNRKLDLSIRSANQKEIITPNDFKEGMIVPGRITKINSEESMNVQIASHTYGRVFITDVDDIYEKKPFSKFEELQFIQVYCINYLYNYFYLISVIF